MEKGQSFLYLGYTIMMCTNNDGIVLLSPENSHCGNFGDDVELAKKYALVYYMCSKPRLLPTIVCRLTGGRGNWGDSSLLIDEIKKDGFDVPSDLEITTDTNRMIILKCN